MKIAIAGAAGRMGRTLLEGVLKDRELSLAAALEITGHAAIGKDAGEFAGSPCGVKVSEVTASSWVFATPVLGSNL